MTSKRVSLAVRGSSSEDDSDQRRRSQRRKTQNLRQ